MSIKVGDKFPSATVRTLKDDTVESLNTAELFKGKRVVLFAVPGAFTPTCSSTHCPSFVRDAEKLKAKGVELVCCTAVNDHYVMDAWGKSQKAEGKILMLADGTAELTKALGMELDRFSTGLGLRSKRYAMIIEDGIVKWIGVDEKGVTNSGADAILANLS